MQWRRTAWVKIKRDLAVSLAKGNSGGSYGDGVMILCAAISALAAEAWPGAGNDKRRFVEALIRHAEVWHPEFISVPLLINGVEEKERDVLREIFIVPVERGIPSTILSGKDVDKPEEEIADACPSLVLRHLRRYSCARLLYEEIRCSYSHEYGPGKKAHSWPPGARIAKTPTTYVNLLSVRCERTRLVHFHIEWIADVAIEIASSLDEQAHALPLREPAKWWLDG